MKDSILTETKSVLYDISKARYLRWVNIIAFIGVIAFNGAAASGGISGYAIGEVSDAYPTDITPAGFAFSIWGIIYTLVGLFCVFQALPQQQNSQLIFGAIGYLFALSCLFNALWICIFSWMTVATTWLSTPAIFAILGCLVLAHRRCNSWTWTTPDRTWVEIVCVDVMLSLYGGWVTVASIVNTSAAFVSSGGTTLGWTAEGWCILMLVVAALINLAMLFRCNDSIFGLVFAWAAVAIADKTPSQGAKTTALVLAGIVGASCGIVGLFRVWKFVFRDSIKLNMYKRALIKEDAPGVPAAV